MNAKDVMSADVITIAPTASVQQVAALLLKHGISALPVLDYEGTLVGIVSEGDLIRRAELNTEQHRRSWWLELVAGKSNEALATEFVKSHARTVGDIMTRDVITAGPETPLSDIATLLEKHRIKRVPIVKGGKLAGIVSRANLIQALVLWRDHGHDEAATDSTIRKQVMAAFRSEEWSKHSTLNATVHGGTVELWGFVGSVAEKEAARVAAELVPGVQAIENNVVVRQVVPGF